MIPTFASRLVNAATFGRVKYGWWGSNFRSDEAPLLLGGCGRSGTTLLHSILNAHSKVYLGLETALFCGNRNLTHLTGVTKMDMQRLRFHYRRSACLGEFAQRVLREKMQEAGKQRWGEKTPHNIRHLDYIFRYFPRARFIHIIRDGRDTVCSLRTHPEFRWENGRRMATGIANPWDECVRTWVRWVQAGLRWRGDHRYREVYYEALVEKPEEVLKPLFEWLELDWEPRTLESFRSDHSATHPGLAQPIYKNGVGRWRSDLPREAMVDFNTAAHNLLASLGYATSDSWTKDLSEKGVCEFCI